MSHTVWKPIVQLFLSSTGMFLPGGILTCPSTMPDATIGYKSAARTEVSATPGCQTFHIPHTVAMRVDQFMAMVAAAAEAVLDRGMRELTSEQWRVRVVRIDAVHMDSVQSMCSQCTVSVQSVHSHCTVSASSVHSQCAVNAQSVCSQCTASVQSMCSQCAVSAQSVYSQCTVSASSVLQSVLQ